MVCFTRWFALFFCLEKRKNGAISNIFEIVASFVALARKVRIKLRPVTDFYADYVSVSIYFTTFAHIIHNR